MKANKPDNANQIQLTGKVVTRKFSEGSKSEHDAMFIETEQGTYELRRLRGNPFFDPELQKLEGKKISANGTVNGTLFLATDIRVIN